MHYVLAMDVGGTTIHAAILAEGVVQTDTITTYDSFADKDKHVIISHLKDIVENQITKLIKLKKNEPIIIKGIGMAFPGPADYDEGISYIKGLEKYDSLYGVNIRNELLHMLLDNHYIRKYLDESFSIQLENDATLFAVGEFITHKSNGFKKIACFTLGTGIGSTFIEEGKVVKGELGIPNSGFIFDVPFQGGTIEDYISKKGISKLAIQQRFNRHINAKELAELAGNGNVQAKKVFSDFGSLLAEAINPFICSFEPDALIFGGQIAKSYNHFEDTFKKNISFSNKLKIEVSDTPLISTFIGANHLIVKT